MNPRYLAYCRAHGRSPEDQMAHDRRAWPGGLMTGFILWVQGHAGGFRKAHPEAWLGDGIADHDAWTRWLEEKADAELKAGV